MVPQVDTQTLLFELEERRRQTALSGAIRSHGRSVPALASRLRRALDSALPGRGTMAVEEEKVPAAATPEESAA